MMSVPPFDQLPLEILLTISRYLDPQDIRRIRRVSRYLNEVCHRRDIWVKAYRNANFIRPPGPFLAQSAHDLEKALIPSFRLDRKLRHSGDTARSGEPALKLREIRHGESAHYVGMVFGRLVFIASDDEVRCYDLHLDAFESNSGGRVLYKTGERDLTCFRCVSSIDIDGRSFACAVLTENIQDEQTRFLIYALNVAEQSEMTLDLLLQLEQEAIFDVQSVDLGPRVIVVQAVVRPGGDWHVVAFDVHSRTRLLFPPFTYAMWGVDEDEDEDEDKTAPVSKLMSVSTSTHLLLGWSFDTEAGPSTVLLAFPLPLPNPHAPSTTLSHSHRGVIPCMSIVHKITLLHDTILDTPTHDVLMTIRAETLRPHVPPSYSEYFLLRFGGSRHDEPATITFQPLNSIISGFGVKFVQPSFRTTGRMFYIRPLCQVRQKMSHRHSRQDLSALEYNVCTDGHRADTPKVSVVDYPSILQFRSSRTVLDYDPYSGRLCLRAGHHRAVEIWDLVM